MKKTFFIVICVIFLESIFADIVMQPTSFHLVLNNNKKSYLEFVDYNNTDMSIDQVMFSIPTAETDSTARFAVSYGLFGSDYTNISLRLFFLNKNAANPGSAENGSMLSDGKGQSLNYDVSSDKGAELTFASDKRYSSNLTAEERAIEIFPKSDAVSSALEGVEKIDLTIPYEDIYTDDVSDNLYSGKIVLYLTQEN